MASELERLARERIKKLLEEEEPKIMAMTADLLENARTADERDGRVLRYPFELFVKKWYIPFRALVTFGVDTVQLASALEKGVDANKKPKSCLFQDWKTVCVSPYNNVALYELSTGKIVTFVPPLVKQHTENNVLRLIDTNLTNNLAASSERTAAGREWEGKAIINQSVNSASGYIDFNESRNELLDNWKLALDYIDKVMRRTPEEMIKYIASILPREIINPRVVEEINKIDPKASSTTKSKQKKEDMLDAFD